ncbi:MAG: hypothetical protein AAF138_07665 [Planctomycetota bacterium]
MRQDALTTEQSMLHRLTRHSGALALAVATIVTTAFALSSAGCAAKGPELQEPDVVVAPYTGVREAVWAVAPVRNESGTALFEPDEIADALIKSAEEARGLRAVPLNRTIAAMRALDMPAVVTPDDALAIADAVGADAVLVAVVTAYDPYDPPTLGLTLALFGDSLRLHGAGPPVDVDPIGLSSAPSDLAALPRTSYRDRPLSTVSEMLDARNHQVLRDLIEFARGRHDVEGPMGYRVYTARMDLFTEFAAATAVDRLLQEERLRLTRERVARTASVPTGG